MNTITIINVVFIVNTPFTAILAKMKTDHHDSTSDSPINKNKPALLRSLFTVGLFCKHFDFDAGLKHSKSSPRVWKLSKFLIRLNYIIIFIHCPTVQNTFCNASYLKKYNIDCDNVYAFPMRRCTIWK